MNVIDVDTHWETGEFAAGTHPLEPWLDGLPVGIERLAHGIAGDLLRALPADRRPDGRTLLPGLVRMAEERGGPVILHPQHASTTSERVAWMDEVGIDHCLVNPGGYWQLLEFLDPGDRARGASRCNDWLGEQLADGRDRLHGVAVVDFRDLGAAAAELARARTLGHRAFFLHTIEGRPPSAVPFGHPDWDVVWSAATDLGMIASIHVGNTASDFGGWADIGWDQPGGAGVTALTRLANTQRVHIAQNILVSMLYGGVFHRHPMLTVVLEEMKIGWLPAFVDACTRQSMPNSGLGDWPFDTTGGEMLRRNVKATPLPGFGDVEALDVLQQLPEMCLFSSDFPHLEGNVDPIGVYGDPLQALGDDLRSAFLGGNAAEAFARTGDPL